MTVKRVFGRNINNGYVFIRQDDHPRADKYHGYVGEHILVAEKALGKYLPRTAKVHHVDENPTNNNSNNLVICEGESYHKLLHRRQKAFEISGNADYRMCTFCKVYDDPQNMTINKNKHYHKSCNNQYEKNRRNYARSNQEAGL